MRSLARAAALCLSILGASVIGAGEASATSTLTPLCVFGSSTCGGGGAGINPTSALMMDGAGNLYGTTSLGGTHNGGVVFQLTPGGTYTELYEFCSAGGASCTDGQTPNGQLIMDVNGNLYGTAFGGGLPHSGSPNGVVFELSPPTGGATAWTYTVIHNFCSSINCTGGGTDGSGPMAGLTYAGRSSGSLYNGTSALYGTTSRGGNPAYDGGAVFKLLPTGSGWMERLIHQFCFCGSPIADGIFPGSGLYMDGSGNLYGTAAGGNSGVGVVYQLVPGAMSWSENILYNFCQTAGVAAYCGDGEGPDTTNVTMDASGNLYGTTVSGGESPYMSVNGGGVVFELSPLDPFNNRCFYGTIPYWCESVLYSFCTADSACSDGLSPSPGIGLYLDPSNNTFYGTAAYGGTNTTSRDAYGVIFMLHSGLEHTIHNFCNPSIGCTDGQMPLGGLIRDSSGAFYGVTYNGGGLSTSPPHYGYGIVYKFTHP